ncbi:MAG TPA: restriction endonuclease subunit R, partial [Paenibacillus sp.]|nr:restriction endonuclease subunit R [Paenibacillus sp.]
MDNIEDKYKAALAHIEELKLEVTRLRGLMGLLDNDNIISTNEQITSNPTSPKKENKGITVAESTVHQYSTVEDKLALYKSYFRGRDDVYPV